MRRQLERNDIFQISGLTQETDNTVQIMSHELEKVREDLISGNCVPKKNKENRGCPIHPTTNSIEKM